MSNILLFHHAQGLTPGVTAFADDLSSAGHVVHTPDLYDGKTFTTLDEGIAYAKEIGFDTVAERARRAAEDLPPELVYAGFSLGGMSAEELAATRPGARGALLLHTAVPLSEFGGEWPQGVSLQIHTMEDDDWGDVDVARELVEEIDGAELFVYPGDRHLFTDSSLSDFDEASAALVKQRVLDFLEPL